MIDNSVLRPVDTKYSNSVVTNTYNLPLHAPKPPGHNLWSFYGRISQWPSIKLLHSCCHHYRIKIKPPLSMVIIGYHHLLSPHSSSDVHTHNVAFEAVCRKGYCFRDIRVGSWQLEEKQDDHKIAAACNEERFY